MQVDDLGALVAVITANAGNIEGKRGALGLLNRLGDWLLTLAHRGRANTVSTAQHMLLVTCCVSPLTLPLQPGHLVMFLLSRCATFGQGLPCGLHTLRLPVLSKWSTDRESLPGTADRRQQAQHRGAL